MQIGTDKEWSVELLCRILHVSESGYCRYLKNLRKPFKDALLSTAIDRIMNESDSTSTFIKYRGLSREQLAKRTSVSRSLISSIEAAGIAKSFSLEVFYNIADAFDIVAVNNGITVGDSVQHLRAKQAVRI